MFNNAYLFNKTSVIINIETEFSIISNKSKNEIKLKKITKQ